MSDRTAIEWTEATWNVINGCAVVSPGCTNCYAMRLAGTRFRDHPTRAGLTVDSKAGPVWNGNVRFIEQVADKPLRWRRPRRIFVCAHGDLFHEAVPDAWIDRVFAVMALAPQHTFQVLTKRPERMRAYLAANDQRRADALGALVIEMGYSDPLELLPWPLPNVWLGVSVEDQTRADERIPILLDTPAAVRWISAEPLLGPVDLTRCGRNAIGLQGDALRWPGMSGPSRSFGARLDWVVAGGESGPGARPMHPDWARQLRDQCAAAGVPFLFKQWGEWAPDSGEGGLKSLHRALGAPTAFWRGERWLYDLHILNREERFKADLYRLGKRAAGRLLDGVQHDGYPEGRA